MLARYSRWCLKRKGGCGRKEVIYTGLSFTTKKATYTCRNCNKKYTTEELEE